MGWLLVRPSTRRRRVDAFGPFPESQEAFSGPVKRFVPLGEMESDQVVDGFPEEA